MAETKPPAVKPDPESSSPAPPLPPPPSQPQPLTPSQPPPQQPPTELLPAKQVDPATPSKDVTPPTDPDFIYIPSHSRWFSWNSIHECEVRFLPEFFDGRSPSKNPRTYKYYRNTIIRRFRDNPTKKINFTEARRTVIGDVGSIRRVFDFLDTWGLINYTANSSKSLIKWEEKEKELKSTSAQNNTEANNGTASNDVTALKKKQCNTCRSPLSTGIACFACDKHDLTICARCYVGNKFRVGLNASDFRRVESNEEVNKTDWTYKETLQLLEALMHYGDDWKKVAEHVGGGRAAKDCVARFVKLPFGEQFIGHPESADLDGELGSVTICPPSKRMCLTPLADASNPIMAQAAFLSALAGKEVAELSAHAAVTALSEIGEGKMNGSLGSLPRVEKQEPDGTSNGYAKDELEEALVEARSQLEKEAQDVETAISDVAIETRGIEERISWFDERDLQMEKEWQQLMQLENLIFVDQLTLLLNKSAAAKAGETIREEEVDVKAER